MVVSCKYEVITYGIELFFNSDCYYYTIQGSFSLVIGIKGCLNKTNDDEITYTIPDCCCTCSKLYWK